MSNAKVLRQLIKTGCSGDLDAFRKVGLQVVEMERQKQHHLLANDLENILYGEQQRHKNSRTLNELAKVPHDKERGLPLIYICQATKPFEEVILPEKSLEPIQDLLEEHRRQDVLRSYGMQPSRKILFYGPPGCGKTLAAESIANELSLPFGIVQLDALVSSYLGETAANLRKVFDYVEQQKMVVLFDEFDALGKRRNDSGEHGELRRVVNAVLQMVDAYQGESIIIAATNHEDILDRAIWRRFDEIIEFPKPSATQIEKILKLKLRGVRRNFETDSPEVLALFKERSGADIERIARRAIKSMLLRNQEFLEIKDLAKAARREIKQ